MLIRNRSYLVMEQAGADGGAAGGAAGAGAGAGGAAGAAGGAAAPAGAAGAAGAGEGDQSLLQAPPAGGASGTPANGGAGTGTIEIPAWAGKVPDKFHVKGADGKLDLEATLLKQADSYTHLERQRGPQAPAAPTDYTFTPPDALKDVKLDDAMSAAFRERAHKAGLTQEQYQFVMQEHLSTLPDLLDGVAKLDKAACEQVLRGVWKSEGEYTAGLADAQRAVNGAPEAIRMHVWERFGRDPAFLQFAASMGKEMREDRTPNPGSASTAAADAAGVEAMMATEAYRNPKHPEHNLVSEKVRNYFQRTGSSAVAS